MVTSWNLPPPPGFQGLRDDLPSDDLRATPAALAAGWPATYFVTFRLEDSLPRSKFEC